MIMYWFPIAELHHLNVWLFQSLALGAILYTRRPKSRLTRNFTRYAHVRLSIGVLLQATPFKCPVVPESLKVGFRESAFRARGSAILASASRHFQFLGVVDKRGIYDSTSASWFREQASRSYLTLTRIHSQKTVGWESLLGNTIAFARKSAGSL